VRIRQDSHKRTLHWDSRYMIRFLEPRAMQGDEILVGSKGRYGRAGGATKQRRLQRKSLSAALLHPPSSRILLQACAKRVASHHSAAMRVTCLENWTMAAADASKDTAYWNRLASFWIFKFESVQREHLCISVMRIHERNFPRPAICCEHPSLQRSACDLRTW
jgi:hypothetical protein